MKKIAIVGLAALATLGPVALQGMQEKEKIAEARAIVEKWVETRQLISKEKAEWEEEKQLLQHRIELFQEEIEALEGTVQKRAEESTQAERERQEMVEEYDQLLEATSVIKETLPEYEIRIRDLAVYFPAPLRDKIQKLLNQVPNDPRRSRKPINERMAIVVGILNEIDKFNSIITDSSMLLEVEAGKSVEMDVIYLGMSQAFFADRKGAYAGIMTPAADEWDVEFQNDIAEEIRDLILVAKGKIKPAKFVAVPVKKTSI